MDPLATTLPDAPADLDLRLHHVGIVVADIAAATTDYQRRFGYRPITEIIHDPVQTAYVQFIQLGDERCLIEFVSPDSPNSKLSAALQRGGGFNHFCFSTTDIERACPEFRKRGMLVLQAPVAATAFPGRRIAWLIGKDKIPIELVERLDETLP